LRQICDNNIDEEVVLDLNDPSAHPYSNRLRPVSRAEFSHDVLEVCFDRLFRNKKRVGYAPQQTNTITRDASMALFAHSVFDFRKDDSFGAGFYYNGISSSLKLDVARLTGSKNGLQNEKGSEIFYDFAITPAVRFIPSYQHIWDPLTAEVTRNKRGADVFLARLAVIW
jgi:Carbohydrate-selective porin, OprB family